MLFRTPIIGWSIILLSAGFSACFDRPDPDPGSHPISHQVWDSLLKTYVDDAGMVDYEGFARDSVNLNRYLDLLSQHAPNPRNWTNKEILAYWINAYNAFTIQLIIRFDPYYGIKKILPFNIPFVYSAWDIRFIRINGQLMDLNDIEHGMIRSHFNEPRIHFALVCAAMSCPKLRNEAYTATKLDHQLEDQARDFINDPAKNQIGAMAVNLSKIFGWYEGDFTHDLSLPGYLNQYSRIKIESTAMIGYLEYDWRLNGQ